MRRAARTDRNHTQIMNTFRQCGCSVLDLSAVGKGCPDLLVGFNGNDYQIEVKDGTKPPSGRKLRDSQELHKLKWKGRKPMVVDSPDGVLDLINNERLSKDKAGQETP